MGAGLAIIAAVILAYVPHLPKVSTSSGLSLASGSARVTGSTTRRQRVFEVTQIAASFVLLAGASALISTLISLQKRQTGLDTQHVLAVDVPAMSYGKTPQQLVDFYKESIRRINALPGVSETAFGDVVPWRDGGGPVATGLQFSADGQVHAAGVEDPRALPRSISPGFFAALGVPIIAGRDFNALDGQENSEPVVIVSQTLAQRMFPDQDALNRHVYWTDPYCNSLPVPIRNWRALRRRTASSASPRMLTMNTSFPSPSLPSTTLLTRTGSLGGVFSFTLRQIPMRWSHRSHGLFATFPLTSPLSMLPLSQMFVLKCSRQTG